MKKYKVIHFGFFGPTEKTVEAKSPYDAVKKTFGANSALQEYKRGFVTKFIIGNEAFYEVRRLSG